MITQCWISRPMEKTIFLRFMYLMTSFSIALTLVEIAQLGARRVRRQIAKEPRCFIDLLCKHTYSRQVFGKVDFLTLIIFP